MNTLDFAECPALANCAPGPCMARVRDGRCIWCERELPPFSSLEAARTSSPGRRVLPPSARRGVEQEKVALPSSDSPSGRHGTPNRAAAGSAPGQQPPAPTLALDTREGERRAPGFTIICAWCEDSRERTAEATARGEIVSHGICPCCAVRFLDGER